MKRRMNYDRINDGINVEFYWNFGLTVEVVEFEKASTSQQPCWYLSTCQWNEALCSFFLSSLMCASLSRFAATAVAATSNNVVKDFPFSG